MTGKSTHTGTPGTPRKDNDAEAAATRGAKASVQEAIGKLIGDDDARARGAAERRAAHDDAAAARADRDPDPSPQG